MSAFALVIDHASAIVGDAEPFFAAVGRARGVDPPAETIVAAGHAAAKFDGATALHRGSLRHEPSGSWLLAAGTVGYADASGAPADLTTLLADFVAGGPSVLSRCDGQFALVAYHGPEGTVSVITDPLGYFSVFAARRGGRTYLSTAALPVARQVASPADDVGVDTFLRTGKVFGERTLWRDVRRLPAATVETFTPSGVASTVYWRPTLDPIVRRLGLDEAVDGTAVVIEAALRNLLSGEGTVWSDLTGGFDTRLLTMSLARAGVPFEANVVGPPDHPDVRIALRIARAMDWSCRHFQLPPDWVESAPTRLAAALGHGNGQLDVLATLRPLWVHEQEAARHPLLLSGMGGELWRGPIWWPERRRRPGATGVHYDRQLWSLMHPVDESIMARPARDGVRAELVARFREAGEHDPDWPTTAKLDRLWLYRETAHAGAWLSLGAGIMRIMTPLFSPRIVAYAMSLDPRLRRGNRVVRHLFERLAPALAEIEVEGRGPAGPIRLRSAHRFLPSRLHRLRRMVDKAAQIALDRRLAGGPRAEGFDRVAWRRTIVDALRREGVLEPTAMATGGLYRRGPFEAFLARAAAPGFGDEALLGRVVTVELAARAVGAEVR